MLAACNVCLAATHGQTQVSFTLLTSSTSITSERGEDKRESVRCTGKYDNISSRIKTTYWHIPYLYI